MRRRALRTRLDRERLMDKRAFRLLEKIAAAYTHRVIFPDHQDRSLLMRQGLMFSIVSAMEARKVLWTGYGYDQIPPERVRRR